MMNAKDLTPLLDTIIKEVPFGFFRRIESKAVDEFNHLIWLMIIFWAEWLLVEFMKGL